VRILITGADGFAGRHLMHELAASGAELHGTRFLPTTPAPPNVAFHTLDLRDEAAATALVAQLRPDQIYHLAGTAAVGQSYSAAWNTLENNLRGQLNLTLACLNSGLMPRILAVSSGEIYGDQLSQPATEDAPFRPTNPYSVSKIAQDMLGLQYFLSSGLPIVRARPFNHIGVGQSPGFVAPDFAMQIARIEAGQQEPVMKVGALDAERDFTDARDVVRAYRLIMERGTPGDAYNVASGTTWTIRALLETLLSFSSASIRVEVDPARLRPGKTSRVWGDASRLRAATGWEPVYPLEQTLRGVLDDCRRRVAESATNHHEESK
jgi:GDP-4-dehydro-6-deoxy-D-mannose reductase